MNLLIDTQIGQVSDETRSKLTLCSSIIRGFLFSLKRERVVRLGGYEKVTLWDIARETKNESDGDCGICFEYALHDSITNHNQMVWPIVSNVINDFCKIKDSAYSILFGAEKNGIIKLINSNMNYLNDDSRILAGTVGKPVYFSRYMDAITQSIYSSPAREKLPSSIRGLWRADLFVGSPNTNQWIGTTLKINKDQLVGDIGLRVGMYPEKKKGEKPVYNEKLNLIMCPLPYDGLFMEMFYKSFFIIRAIVGSDCNMPKPIDLPDSGDRLIAGELIKIKEYPAVEVIDAIRRKGQPNLVTTSGDITQQVDAVAPIVTTKQA